MTNIDNNQKSSEIQMDIRIDGINAIGFGILAKFAMFDRDLDITAKGIYSYFCSMAGDKYQAFPSLNKILYDLNIAESTYYLYYHQLIDNEYIRVKQEKIKNGIFSKNIITIVLNPKKFELQALQKPLPNESLIRSQGMKAHGYGIIPRAVMFDRRLEIKAKAIYAYFCLYANAGTSAFPKRDTILYHLNIGAKAYYKYYNALIALNYISVVQRVVNGRKSVNDYYINEFPDSNACNPVNSDNKTEAELPCSHFQGTDENTDKSANLPCSHFQGSADATDKSTDLPCSHFQGTHKPCAEKQGTQKPCAEKQGTNSTRFNIPSFDNLNTQSINQSIDSMDGWMDSTNDFELQRKNRERILSEILQYGELPVFYRENPVKLAEAIKVITEIDCYYETKRNDSVRLCVQALIDLCLLKTSITLKGSLVTYARVFEVVNRNLDISRDGDYATISEVVSSTVSDFEKAITATKVRDPMVYMKACLWNALNTNRIELENSLRMIGITSYDEKE